MGLFSKPRKYYAMFLIPEQNGFCRIGKKRFRPTDKTVSFRGKPYPIDIALYSYSRGLKYFYFFHVNDGGQMDFVEGSKVPIEMLEIVVKRGIINQIANALISKGMTIPIMVFIVGCLFGGMFGFILAGYV